MTRQYEAWGQCDCCGKQRWTSQVWAGELETWACAECRGGMEEEPDPDAKHDARRTDPPEPFWMDDL